MNKYFYLNKVSDNYKETFIKALLSLYKIIG